MRFHLILIWCFIYSVSASHKHHENAITLQNSTNGSYEPTWDSLDKRPLPVWYDKAKVGIFIHWGVYSVPSYGSEWFWKNWRQSRKPDYVKYMTKNYKPGFTYQEFAPQFTAEFFNASEWVDIFRSSGAKYVVLTSKHHEGYALWPSKYSYSWNSMDVGPHRDIVGELSTAVRLDGSMTFGLYHSLFEWFHPAYLADKSSHHRDNNFVSTKVIPEMIELIEKYEPEVLWSDGDGGASDSYWNSTQFLAWLYNSSPVRETIVANDRWGNNTNCKHGDFYTCNDRYNPGVLVKHKWENAMTLDKFSWGYRTNAKLSDYMTSEELISQIVSTVSCNGNILINVGPTKEGIIEPIFQERLRDMGDWLRVNGEAIYESIPWVAQNDSTSKDVWYTYRHFEDGKSAVYATVLKYPFETSGVMLGSLAKVANGNETVQILGLDDALETSVSSEGVYVKFPNKNKLDSRGLKFAWTLKITGLEM